MGNWYNLMTFKRGRTLYVPNSSHIIKNIQQELGNGVPFTNPKVIVGSSGFVFNTESKLYNRHSISGQTLDIQRYRTPMQVYSESLKQNWVYSVGHTSWLTPTSWSISQPKTKMLIFDFSVVTGRYTPSRGIGGGLPDFFEPNVLLMNAKNNAVIKQYTSRSQWDWSSVNPQYNVYKSGDMVYEESRNVRYIIETNGDLYGNSYKINVIPLELENLISKGRETLLKLYSCTYFINLFVYITLYYETNDDELGSDTLAYVFEG